jgi:hypothetical protein
MDETGFDALTRAVAQNTSRRATLKLIVGGLLAGIGALFTRRSSTSQTVAAEANTVYLPLLRTADAPRTFAEAPAERLAALETQAGEQLPVRVFQAQMAAAGFALQSRAGLQTLRGSSVETETLVVTYTKTNTTTSVTERAYLAYGSKADETPIAFLVRYNPAVSVLFGVYRAADGAVEVELEQPVTPNMAAPQAVLPQPIPLQAGNEACRVCAETCAGTNQLRGDACVIRTIGTAVNAGFATRSLLRNAAEDAIGAIGDLGALNTSLNGIRSCLEQQPLDCSATGSLCRSLCQNCSGGAGACLGTDICVGGACRTPCGSSICQVGEICGPNGTCVQPEDQCAPERYYMGLYRFGTSLRAACCPFPNNVNCGAATSGIWGGCCPTGTICFPVGEGYGCCFPGGTCDLF